MKLFFLFCLSLIISIQTLAQNYDVIFLNGQQFVIKSIEGTERTAIPYMEIKLYHEDLDVLSHIISEEESDHMGVTIQLGAYSTKGNQLILYSYWAWAGEPANPFYGVRKQVYNATPDGELIFNNGEIYIETVKQGEESDEYDGSEFLFTKPIGQEQINRLRNYKETVKSNFQATFVEGVKKERLLKEVKLLLQKEIRTTTNRWRNFDCDYKN